MPLFGTNREEKMSETVTGYIDHIIFRNEENGYREISIFKDGVVL